jgi:predicted DNA-binding antitoxin AbrB/MazE fold protein
MAITIEAVYENGVLRLSGPLPFKEHERVRVTVESALSPLLGSYGIMVFKGTAEEAERFALHPDFLPEEGR